MIVEVVTLLVLLVLVAIVCAVAWRLTLRVLGVDQRELAVWWAGFRKRDAELGPD